MQYEALYAAVLSAAPVVLIGYVVEHRLVMQRGEEPLLYREKRLAFIVIVGVVLSAVMSVIALAGSRAGNSLVYATIVSAGLCIGISGLGSLLWYGIKQSGAGKHSPL